ncbi:MAG: bifunctional [glutamine synthetase] adenylyltransferase/[glutamine synthetase]-adenylyl-L-tyrosine phosphorylase, partial [Pseudomonadota bacterium]
EQGFRASVQVLETDLAPEAAGRGFSAIAEASLAELAPRTAADLASRHGLAPGRGMVVLALGKLGTREMTAGSDLDLITVYDAAPTAMSEGPRPIAATAYYPRLMKALLAALTAPTAEGRLYEVDMRLRPSGRAGPVAVSLDAFRRYHAEAAEVWEHMALSRARVVATIPGEAGAGAARALGEDVMAVVGTALARRAAAPAETAGAAAAMRVRLIEAHAAERPEPWALKHAAGGVMEIEFTAQTGALITGRGLGMPARTALVDLATAGWLAPDEAATLSATLALEQRLQQTERAALAQAVSPDRFGTCLYRVFARAGGTRDFETLTAHLAEAQSAAAAVVARRFDRLTPDTPG